MTRTTSRKLRRASILPVTLALACGLVLLQATPMCAPQAILEAEPAPATESVESATTDLESARLLTPEEFDRIIANADDRGYVVVFLSPFAGPEGPEGPQGPPGPAGPQGPAGSGAVVGEVRMWAGNFDLLPLGWLECDGSEVSRTTYAELFQAIGEGYGSGDGSTTFNLPNFRDRSPMGAGLAGMHGEPLTAVSGQPLPFGGAPYHHLVNAELPMHQHGMTHTHQVDVSTDITSGTQYLQTGIDNGGTIGTLPTSGSSAALTGPVGNGAAHNNLHPYFAITYMIYAGE